MRIVIASTVVLCLVDSVSPVWPADAATPLVVEARIKEGPKRRFQTRIVDHLDHFDASSREPLDVYGGWKTKRYDATGFFYPKKIGDRWWLIDPQGYRFLHIAVNSVSPGDSPTNRETLSQRFGSLERWRDETTALLRNHGFNGTGNWSDDKLLRTGTPRLVQTPRLNFMGSYGRETGRVVQEPGHLGYPNRCIFVFDPQGETAGGPQGRSVTNFEYFVKLAQRIIVNMTLRTAEGGFYEIDTRLARIARLAFRWARAHSR